MLLNTGKLFVKFYWGTGALFDCVYCAFLKNIQSFLFVPQMKVVVFISLKKQHLLNWVESWALEKERVENDMLWQTVEVERTYEELI